jgi:MFS family permease
MTGMEPAVTSRERLSMQVWALVGAGFVVAVGYGIVAPALPEFARSFDVGVTAASAVVSGFALCRLLFAPGSGWLLHRIGELRMFCLGVIVVGGSSVACYFVAGYFGLLFFRGIGGVGSTMFTVASASLLIRISPPTMRGRTAAAWATAFLLGTIAGPLIGGGLTAISLRAPFLIYAGLLGLAAVIVAVTLRGHWTARTIPEGCSAPTVTFRSARRNRTFRACLTSNFLHGWTVYGVRVALVPLFVVDVLHLPSSWAGAALTAFAVGTAATLMLGGQLADRWGRQKPALAGSLLVTVTMAGLGFTTSPVEVLMVCALSGVGTGLLTPPVNAAVADVLSVDDDRGTRNGVALAGYQSVGDLGAVVGPVLAGLIVDYVGYKTAFALTVVLSGASIWTWLRAPDASRGAIAEEVLPPPAVESNGVSGSQSGRADAPLPVGAPAGGSGHVRPVAGAYPASNENAVQSTGDHTPNDAMDAER